MILLLPFKANLCSTFRLYSPLCLPSFEKHQSELKKSLKHYKIIVIAVNKEI